MTLPGINLRRVYLIARRDFLGYVKTWGFWISFILPFVFGALGFMFAQMDINVEPLRYETILDDTGEHRAGIEALAQSEREEVLFTIINGLADGNVISEDDAKDIKARYQSEGDDGIQAYVTEKYPALSNGLKIPAPKYVFVDPPADTLDELRPYLRGEKDISHNGEPTRLNGVLHIYEKDGSISIDHWSPNITNLNARSLARRYFNAKSTERYLATGGLTTEGLQAAKSSEVSIGSFDPTKEITDDADSQAVTMSDRIPFIVAAIMTVILWLTVFSGSYMLLTSMLEEKLNKLLEMMLASTRFSEIIFGKLLGVAALTITAMLPYLAFGAIAVVMSLVMGDPEVTAGIMNAFTPKLIIFFFVFLILGYVFYGAFFIALGALASSMQDAQTLTTPIMLVLTACVMVVPVGLQSPDSPILTIASWFPLSAPFAAMIRLPLDPPWWELTLSAVFVFICAMGVIWIAGRIFRYGVLSGAGMKSVQMWFSRVILRRKPS